VVVKDRMITKMLEWAGVDGVRARKANRIVCSRESRQDYGSRGTRKREEWEQVMPTPILCSSVLVVVVVLVSKAHSPYPYFYILETSRARRPDKDECYLPRLVEERPAAGGGSGTESDAFKIQIRKYITMYEIFLVHFAPSQFIARNFNISYQIVETGVQFKMIASIHTELLRY
jgi:hypothetical protein